MKRKAKKAVIGRKERHLTPAELKKISAGIAAAARLHPAAENGFEMRRNLGGDIPGWRY
jgi:hypothetical protein